MTYQFVEVNGTQLHYHVTGSGPPLVLLHAGIADLSMWDQQVDAFSAHFQVIRYDVRGWGQSPSPTRQFAHHDDLYGLLQHLDVGPAAMVGISHGGKIALDFTLVYPKMVSALVLVAPAVSGYEFIDKATNQIDAAIAAAYERGDIDTCIDLETQLWVDGPQRIPEQIDPTVRATMRRMIAATYRLPQGQGEPQSLDPPAIDRLGEIKVPTQIIVGGIDVPDMLAIADLLAANIAGAKKVMIPGVAHMVNLEKPEFFNRLILDFLKGCGQ
jgi:3-oxoadipate enol-lactonase